MRGLLDLLLRPTYAGMMEKKHEQIAIGSSGHVGLGSNRIIFVWGKKNVRCYLDKQLIDRCKSCLFTACRIVKRRGSKLKPVREFLSCVPRTRVCRVQFRDWNEKKNNFEIGEKSEWEIEAWQTASAHEIEATKTPNWTHKSFLPRWSKMVPQQC